MRRNSALRRVLLPLALVIGVLSVGASSAQALNEHHYNTFLAAGTGWVPTCCVSNPQTTTGNIAAYTGAGSVGVCQMTYDLDYGTYRTGCAINAVGNAYNLMPYYGHNLFPGIKNNSPWGHTIHGWAYWN